MTEQQIEQIIQNKFGTELPKLRRKWFLYGGLSALLIPLTVWAATISKPHTFADGDTLSASKLNENFDALFTEINAKENRLTAVEGQAGYDSTLGSFIFSMVNGTKTKVYTKYISGTTSGTANKTIPHGFGDITKILSVQMMYRESPVAFIRPWTYYSGNNATVQMEMSMDTNNIQIQNIGSNLSGNWIYLIKIDYTQ